MDILAGSFLNSGGGIRRSGRRDMSLLFMLLVRLARFFRMQLLAW
jgi:hypothetical protein